MIVEATEVVEDPPVEGKNLALPEPPPRQEIESPEAGQAGQPVIEGDGEQESDLNAPQAQNTTESPAQQPTGTEVVVDTPENEARRTAWGQIREIVDTGMAKLQLPEGADPTQIAENQEKQNQLSTFEQAAILQMDSDTGREQIDKSYREFLVQDMLSQGIINPEMMDQNEAYKELILSLASEELVHLRTLTASMRESVEEAQRLQLAAQSDNPQQRAMILSGELGVEEASQLIEGVIVDEGSDAATRSAREGNQGFIEGQFEEVNPEDVQEASKAYTEKTVEEELEDLANEENDDGTPGSEADGEDTKTWRDRLRKALDWAMVGVMAIRPDVEGMIKDMDFGTFLNLLLVGQASGYGSGWAGAVGKENERRSEIGVSEFKDKLKNKPNNMAEALKTAYDDKLGEGRGSNTFRWRVDESLFDAAKNDPAKMQELFVSLATHVYDQGRDQQEKLWPILAGVLGNNLQEGKKLSDRVGEQVVHEIYRLSKSNNQRDQEALKAYFGTQ